LGRRRQYFTLIELFLALGVLALLGSLVLVKTRPLLDHYRFGQGVAQLRQEIDLTRRLSNAAHADMTLHVKQTEKGLLLRRETDEPLAIPRTFDVSILIPHLMLKEKDLDLTFTGSGWMKEEHKFTVYFKNRSLTLELKNS
jgi:hypothetical protein